MAGTRTDELIGTPAPPFCLPGADRKVVCLASFLGKWVVLYFYPRDNTPGCTLEAIHFNEALKKFGDLGAVVIGVSTDPPESHQKFAAKHALAFLLLSDTAHDVIAAYGSWKPKSMFGKEFFGTQRDTFLINPEGTIAAVWRRVSPATHEGEVETLLRTMQEKGRNTEKT